MKSEFSSTEGCSYSEAKSIISELSYNDEKRDHNKSG